MYDVLIHSPFSKQTGQGNSMTADRTELILGDAGLDVEVEAETYEGADARCLVALNAWRSAGVVAAFNQTHPGRQVVVVVTGSDINHPEMADENSDTRRTMERADALVTLHEADLKELPEKLRQKAVCIFPSVILPASIKHLPESKCRFEVVMAGNLRAVKNPQLAVKLASMLPSDSPIFNTTYGDASTQLANEMSRANAEFSQFNWFGKLDHATLLEKMASADVLLNTSTVEGGANAICEAVTMGLPVIASDIRGNVGMLGDDYPGIYPSEDAQAALLLLQRCVEDASFYALLKNRIDQRAPLFDFATESSAWVDLIRSRLAL